MGLIWFVADGTNKKTKNRGYQIISFLSVYRASEYYRVLIGFQRNENKYLKIVLLKIVLYSPFPHLFSLRLLFMLDSISAYDAGLNLEAVIPHCAIIISFNVYLYCAQSKSI